MLLLGLGLAALAAIDMSHKAIGAQDRTSPNADTPSVNLQIDNLQIGNAETPASDRSRSAIASAPTPPAAAIMTDAPETDSLTEISAEVERPDTDTKTLAINSAPDNGQLQPNVTQMSPEEFAIAAWAGASFPVENFQAYTSPFGYRRSATGGYRQEFHYGLDIASPQGSYIRSWWSGKVVEVTDNTNCGTSVVISSGEWLHIYCHMQGRVETQGSQRYMIDRGAGVQIWEGQDIVAGDRIGRVGMTGRTTGPHLHWGLKYQGNWVDPAWVLQAMAVSQQAMSNQ